jgi:hypothetical protein
MGHRPYTLLGFKQNESSPVLFETVSETSGEFPMSVSSIPSQATPATPPAPADQPEKTSTGVAVGPSVVQAPSVKKDAPTDPSGRAAFYSAELSRASSNGANLSAPARDAIISELGFDPKNYRADKFQPDDERVQKVVDVIYARCAKKGDNNSWTEINNRRDKNAHLWLELQNQRKEFAIVRLSQLDQAVKAAQDKDGALKSPAAKATLLSTAHWVLNSFPGDRTTNEGIDAYRSYVFWTFDDITQPLDVRTKTALSDQPRLAQKL